MIKHVEIKFIPCETMNYKVKASSPLKSFV